MIQLKILVDTVLKLKPIQSTDLPDDQKQAIAAGTLIELQSYAIEGAHIKVAFAKQSFKGRNTWYVYGRHAQILQNGKSVVLMGLQLEITADTILKTKPVQSTQLAEADKQAIATGTILNLQSYLIEGDHIKVAFLDRVFKGRNTWYAYLPHVRLLSDGQALAKAGSKTLTTADYQKAAAALTVPVAVVRAVVAVETDGGGFLPDGRPKILFEAAWFSDYTKGQYDAKYPNISSPTWNRSLYVGGAGEYKRLDAAIALNRSAALMSASWGLGQIMGGNYAAAGYSNVEDFVKDMYESEGKQLLAMVNFIKSNGLAPALRRQDWAAFAQGYNGEGYRQNRYDEKLAAAYQSFLA